MHKILLLFFTQFLFLYYNNNLTKDNIPQIDILSPEELENLQARKDILKWIYYCAQHEKQPGYKEALIILNFLESDKKKTRKINSNDATMEFLPLLPRSISLLFINKNISIYDHPTHIKDIREANIALKEDFEQTTTEFEKDLIKSVTVLLNLLYKDLAR